MKNYTDNDYALNKHSKGIVYKFVDCIVEVTLEQYLEENPDKTEADYAEMKNLSDNDYLERDREGYQQTWKNVPLNGLDETNARAVDSPEDKVIERSEQEEKQARMKQALSAMAKLTDTQRRRYLMYHVNGLSMREIADIEGCHFTTVDESLKAAQKKLNKYLKNA